MIDTEQGFLAWWEEFSFLKENEAWEVFRAMLRLEAQTKAGCADRAVALASNGKPYDINGLRAAIEGDAA